MTDMIGIFIAMFFSLILPAMVILFLVTLIRSKESIFKFNSRSLIRAYAYMVSFITLSLMVMGLVLFTKASFTYILGYQFSYEVTAVNQFDKQNFDRPPSRNDVFPSIPDQDIDHYNSDSVNNYNDSKGSTKVINIAGQDYQVNTQQVDMDLLSGLVLLFISGGFLLLHRLGLYYLFPKNGKSLLEKVYLYTNLGITSFVSLIFLPLAIYEILEYIILDVPLTSYSRTIPGVSLAIALVVTPLWIYFLIRAFIRNKSLFVNPLMISRK